MPLRFKMLVEPTSEISVPLLVTRQSDHWMQGDWNVCQAQWTRKCIPKLNKELCRQYKWYWCNWTGVAHSHTTPIPRIQETLDCPGGNSWISVLDQGKACHQGFMDEQSQPLTAFITPWGLYEWVRIPFTLKQCTCKLPAIYSDRFRRPWRYGVHTY